MSEGPVKKSNRTGVSSTHSDQAIELHQFAATMQPFAQTIVVVHDQQLVHKDYCSCSNTLIQSTSSTLACTSALCDALFENSAGNGLEQDERFAS